MCGACIQYIALRLHGVVAPALWKLTHPRNPGPLTGIRLSTRCEADIAGRQKMRGTSFRLGV